MIKGKEGHHWEESMREGSSDPIAAFIGRQVECKGVIRFKGNVRIEGRLEGEILTQGTILVGEQAVVNAKIQAGSIISKGRISGTIVAQKEIRLFSSAILQGSMNTPHLSMEKGARLETHWSLWIKGSRLKGSTWQKTGQRASLTSPSWRKNDNHPRHRS